MRDKEYIEMKRKEGMYAQREKPLYALRKKDFIPFIGMKKHLDRCLEESSPLQLTSEWYNSQCIKRDLVLALYNVAITSATIFSLAELLNK